MPAAIIRHSFAYFISSNPPTFVKNNTNESYLIVLSYLLNGITSEGSPDESSASYSPNNNSIASSVLSRIISAA